MSRCDSLYVLSAGRKAANVSAFADGESWARARAIGDATIDGFFERSLTIKFNRAHFGSLIHCFIDLVDPSRNRRLPTVILPSAKKAGTKTIDNKSISGKLRPG